jgi:hypothetical protein
LAQTVNPATLTYVASSVSIASGATLPALSGAVTGFVGTDTQANSTTGTITFTTTATPSSGAGNYPIDGGGLTAINGNYLFAQAPANATALTITSTARANFTSASLSGSLLQMTLTAGPGQTYALERSTSLVKWTPLITNTVPSAGTLTFTDSPATNNPKTLFYRARLVQFP